MGVKAYQSQHSSRQPTADQTEGLLTSHEVAGRTTHQSNALFSWLFKACVAYQLYEWLRVRCLLSKPLGLLLTVLEHRVQALRSAVHNSCTLCAACVHVSLQQSHVSHRLTQSCCVFQLPKKAADVSVLETRLQCAGALECNCALGPPSHHKQLRAELAALPLLCAAPVLALVSEWQGIP